MAEQLVDTGGHFSGGLVGKGDGEDGVGSYAFFLDEPGDAAGNYASFAGACAGEDEQGTFSGFDCGSLFGIQIVSERVQGSVRREGSLYQCIGLGCGQPMLCEDEEAGIMIKMINLYILIIWGKVGAWLRCPQPARSRILQL